MGYEWYADVFFLTNFLMDSAALFAAAVCCSRPLKPGRTFIAGALSALVGILVVLCTADKAAGRLIIHLAVNPLMVVFVFRPVGLRDFLRLFFTVYLILFFAGGVQESFLFVFGIGRDWQIAADGVLAAAAFCVYMLRRKTLQYVCTVDLWLLGEKVTVRAFCDSGNLLRDPANGKPVSILQEQVLKKWKAAVPDAVRIPCRTVSENRFYLDVITIDKMEIYMRGTLKQIKTPEIGLCAEPPMRHPPVEMLLHSAYLG